jgi:hypothetical protein
MVIKIITGGLCRVELDKSVWEKALVSSQLTKKVTPWS